VTHVNVRMRSIIPLQDCSRDLGVIIEHVLHEKPWNIELVKSSLECFQSWAKHAADDEVKVAITYPKLAQVVMDNTAAFFQDPNTIFTAAEVFNEFDSTEGLPDKTIEVLVEILLYNGVVRESYAYWKEGRIDFMSFRSIASLAIAMSEATIMKPKPTPPPFDLREDLLNMMMFLLDSEVGSLTFTFWIELCEGYYSLFYAPWLQRILLILLARCKQSRDVDEDEWKAFREDVVELFEAICLRLGSETVEPIVLQYLTDAIDHQEAREVALVIPVDEVH